MSEWEVGRNVLGFRKGPRRCQGWREGGGGGTPVVVSSNQEQVLPEDAQVLSALGHVHHVVGGLEQQPLPVVNLHKEDQEPPGGESGGAQAWPTAPERLGQGTKATFWQK